MLFFILSNNIHVTCDRLIERLAERGMSHYPVMVEQAHTDQQIEDAGHRFVEQAFAPVLHWRS